VDPKDNKCKAKCVKLWLKKSKMVLGEDILMHQIISLHETILVENFFGLSIVKNTLL
jgi:hypothetical protein